MRTVGCRITVVKTGLFCEIELGWLGGQEPQKWLKLENKMARLGIGKDGQWAYLVEGSDKYTGLCILPPAPTSIQPDGSLTFSVIADLYGVPENFSSGATCGNYLNGDGLWIATKEAVKWEMFLPCV